MVLFVELPFIARMFCQGFFCGYSCFVGVRPITAVCCVWEETNCFFFVLLLFPEFKKIFDFLVYFCCGIILLGFKLIKH